jgi:glucokinase
MTVLACDLGGTRMKIGVVRDGQLLASALEPAHASQGLAPQLPRLLAVWQRQLESLQLRVADCAGASLAFPSLVDTRSGRILFAYGKYPDGPHLDLPGWAKAELGLPLAIDNDARMAVIGEWRAGAGRGHDDVVMITLGTGLGTGVVSQGRVLRGKHGQAGVLGGHLTVRHGGRACTCGNVGCAEAEASTSTLAEVARDVPGFVDSPLARVAKLDYAQLFAHAALGDPAGIALRDHSLAVWSSLAVNLIHAHDPEVVILGGGIMASADIVLPAVRAHVARHAHTPWGKVQVVAAELGDGAALLAGEWLVQELRRGH